MEFVLDFVNGESTNVNSLKEKLTEKRSPSAHLCAQSAAKDQSPPAAQIWGPPETSFLEPLQGSILELKNEISSISKRIHLIQSTDPSSNLVLYGIPKTVNNTETLTDNLVSTVAEKLKLHISATQIIATRVGNLKPPPGHRPCPVRIHFRDSVDCLEIWKARSCLKRTQLTLSEDLTRRERIQRSILRTLTQSLIPTNQN